MFKLYTQENCPNCEELKGFLKSQGVDFEEVDVNNDTKARAFMIMNDLETTPAVQTDNNIFAGDVEVMKQQIGNIL